MRSTLASFFILFSFGAHAGVFIENGGDTVYCSASGKFLEDWMYVLDFALDFPDDLNKIFRSDKLEGYLNRAESLLLKNAPELLLSFRDFRRSIPTVESLPIGTSYGNRQWLPSEQPLRDVQDEQVRILPENCRVASNGIFIQTVIRKKAGQLITYSYDLGVMTEYIKFDPLQASTILTHEWLWDHLPNAPSVRKANAFLHSISADTTGPLEFRKKLGI